MSETTAVVAPPAAQSELPQWEDYARCIHCGLCLNHCPTYRLLGVERDSPRGRIRQMVLVNEGQLEVGNFFVRHIDACLDCRACETACPSGVEYGRLVEATRALIAKEYRRPFLRRWLRRLAFYHLLPYPKRIALAGRLLDFYQNSGLRRLVRASGILRLLPGHFEEIELLQPAIEKPFFYEHYGKVFPARGERRARVAFFAGCIANVSFARLNEATVRVLQENGCDVVVPAKQLCCGALAVHAGEREVAQELARKNVAAFLEEKLDAIVTNAAGCGSTLKEYDRLLAGDAELAEEVRWFGSRLRDVTEFLMELGVRPPERPLMLRITYQDSCHLVHGQRIRQAPRQLIHCIPGVEFVEMRYSDQCCGSAGIYNVVENELAMALLDEKMRHARAAGAEVIATANPGCILQLRAGVERAGTGQEVLHVVELLDRAYGARSGSAI